MASAWGKAWGKAWGNAWGMIAPAVVKSADRRWTCVVAQLRMDFLIKDDSPQTLSRIKTRGY